MTLLSLEKQCIDETFSARWQQWQQEAGLALPYSHHDTGLLHDHLAFMLYEHFPTVAFGAARQVMLAARAAGMHSFLIQLEAEGGLPAPDGERARAWLSALAEAQLRPLIPDDAPFWQGYARWPELSRRAALDVQAAGAEAAHPLDMARLAERVAGKTAAAYQSTAAFAQIANRPEIRERVQQAQHHLYIGVQLHHDMLHWKGDFVGGRRSYLLATLLAEAPDLIAADDPQARREQLPEVGQRLYYNGLADRLLLAISEHLCRSMAMTTALPPTSWGAFVSKLLEQNEQLRRDVDQIRNQKLAARPRRPPAHSSPAPDPTPAPPAALDRAIDHAARYLAREQAADGSWGDFMLLAEQSTYWVTGYVGWTLQQTRPAAADLPRAALWLLDQQYPGGGWGYNSHWPVDVDTTANALLFLSSRAEVDSRQWSPALHVILSGQRAGGGFTTILHVDAWVDRFRIRTTNLDGWTAMHPCVTAVVALLLGTLDGPERRGALEQTLHSLWACQTDAGYWQAYWWVSPYYTTCRMIQAARRCGVAPSDPRLARARAWLLAAQAADGGWRAEPQATSAGFHTALALLALAELNDDGAATPAIRRGVYWLLEHQQSDGSWAATPMLRVPQPQIKQPWEQDTWRESILGLNVVVPDWHRLFSTATALQALHACARAEV